MSEKTVKRLGNKIVITETIVREEDISVLEAEKQGCLNAIESYNKRIAEIDALLRS